MTRKTFHQAIEDAIIDAMARDERVCLIGEDVRLFHSEIHTRFGNERVLNAPISEAAFLGAGVAAAMAGMRPIVEIMLVDFITVAMSAVVNEMAKVEAFSGGRMRCPVVVRASCGGGYGDGGQHEQTLWGMLAAVPGLQVVVPSTPADAAGLMTAAVESERPTIFLEHKLLSDFWLDAMGGGGRDTVTFDVPADGREGPVGDGGPLPFGRAVTRRRGTHVTLASLGVGVHRCLEAARHLADEQLECEVIDLRSVRPLDRDALRESVARTEALVVVDEDYEQFGLSGEAAAVCLEAGKSFRFARVCTRETIPFARHLEDAVLPNVERIAEACRDVAAR